MNMSGVIFDTSTPQELQKELDELGTKHKRIRDEYAVIESDLSGFQCAGYDHFKSKVLPTVLNHVAHLRAECDPADEKANRELAGRYDQVKDLMNMKPTLERRAQAVLLEQATILKQINTTQERLAKKLSREQEKV